MKGIVPYESCFWSYINCPDTRRQTETKLESISNVAKCATFRSLPYIIITCSTTLSWRRRYSRCYPEASAAAITTNMVRLTPLSQIFANALFQSWQVTIYIWQCLWGFQSWQITIYILHCLWGFSRDRLPYTFGSVWEGFSPDRLPYSSSSSSLLTSYVQHVQFKVTHLAIH